MRHQKSSLNINVLLELGRYNKAMEAVTALTWGLTVDRVAEVLQPEQQEQRSGSQQHEEPQRPEDGAGSLHDRRRSRTA